MPGITTTCVPAAKKIFIKKPPPVRNIPYISIISAHIGCFVKKCVSCITTSVIAYKGTNIVRGIDPIIYILIRWPNIVSNIISNIVCQCIITNISRACKVSEIIPSKITNILNQIVTSICPHVRCYKVAEIASIKYISISRIKIRNKISDICGDKISVIVSDKITYIISLIISCIVTSICPNIGWTYKSCSKGRTIIVTTSIITSIICLICGCIIGYIITASVSLGIIWSIWGLIISDIIYLSISNKVSRVRSRIGPSIIFCICTYKSTNIRLCVRSNIISREGSSICLYIIRLIIRGIIWRVIHLSIFKVISSII